MVGVSKLRTKYESHEAKRQLCNSYDMFAADERILPSLPKLLGTQAQAGRKRMARRRRRRRSGRNCMPVCCWRAVSGPSPHPFPPAGKAFFKKKKQPVPVRLTGKDWAAQIRKACEATYLFWSGGNSLTIKVARSSHSAQQCVDNALAAIDAAVQKCPRKWEGVQVRRGRCTTALLQLCSPLVPLLAATRTDATHVLTPPHPTPAGAVPQDGRQRVAAGVPGAAGCGRPDQGMTRPLGYSQQSSSA